MTYDKNNIFSKIIRKEAPSTTVFENENAMVIKNLYPKAPCHLLVLPKGEYESYTRFGLLASAQEKLDLIEAINFVIKEYNLDEKGYRLVANTGDYGGQSVPHFHIHVLGGEKLADFGL
ncbi:MAG: HIT domain-containing protein [bacterium]|nr:HIT domain-containing protein [bacterium]